uniref:Secreted protein n=1 Tax=Macrostomum lignano TaxID=282301 RepID=A0A1I8FPF1_9PLAT
AIATKSPQRTLSTPRMRSRVAIGSGRRYTAITMLRPQSASFSDFPTHAQFETAIENIVAVRILSLNNQQLQATVLICSSKSMLLKGRAAAVSSLLLLVLLLVGTRCQARPVRGPESEEHEEFYPEEEEEEFFPGKKGGSVVSEELLKKLLAGRDEVSRSSKDIQKAYQEFTQAGKWRKQEAEAGSLRHRHGEE